MITIKTPEGLFFFLVEIDMLILKFILKCKQPGIVKTTLRRRSKVGGLTLSDFNNFYITIVIETV